MSVQLNRRPAVIDGPTVSVPLRGRVVVEGRLPVDDDSAPYPAAGCWFWDQLLEQRMGVATRG